MTANFIDDIFKCISFSGRELVYVIRNVHEIHLLGSNVH